jgi:hypothetical protein
MSTRAKLIGVVVVAVVAGLALWLRPHRIGREELVATTSIPAPVRTAIRTKMLRHHEQMQALVSRVVLMDGDGVARVAGEIFDEPALARPLVGDELNGFLPERFFVLRDEMRARARALVIATQPGRQQTLADEFAGLAKTCIACHQLYLQGEGGNIGGVGDVGGTSAARP